MMAATHKDTDGERVLDKTLPEALQKWVGVHPDKKLWTYLDDAGRATADSVTYRQLDQKTRALRDTLLAGTKGTSPLVPGDRVLLVYPPSLHFIVAFVACIRAGLVAVPVYPPDPRKLSKDMQAFSRTTASCGARVALTSSAYDHVKKAAGFKARLTGSASEDSRWPDALQWLVTDKSLPKDPSGATAAAAADSTDRSSLAFLQYTSGSTGNPKGVKITHENLAHNLGAVVKELDAGSDTVVVSWLPQYHDMGLIGSVLGTLYCGGTGYYLSPLDFVRSPPTWITAVSEFRATHLQAPNFGFALTARKWKALKKKPEVDLSSVVHVINGAEPIDAGSIETFEEIFRPYGFADGVIKGTYGLAEHTVFVCSGGKLQVTVDRRALEVEKTVKLAAEGDKRDSTAWCTLVGCGYPGRVDGLQLLIVEPSGMRILPEDAVGEVWLRSPSKANGYWGLPDKSTEAFCALPVNGAATEGTEVDVPREGSAADRDADPAAATEDVVGGSTSTPNSDTVEKKDPSAVVESHSIAEAGDHAGQGGAGRDWSQGYLRTGDEGFMHRGELFICGRIKDLIIIAGRNHYPQDLERTAERGRDAESIRPGCSAAFSVPGAGAGEGEQLVLTVELREAEAKASAARRRALGEEIRAAVAKEHGVTVHDLLLLAPRANIKTTSGKIARQWCRRAFLDGKMKPLLHLTGAVADGEGDVGGSTANKTNNDMPSTQLEGGRKTAGSAAVGEAVVAVTEGAGRGEAGGAAASASKEIDVGSMSDEELLIRLQQSLSAMGDTGGGLPSPEAPFYTLGLSSMTAAQFSGLLEQDYGARVPLSMLDADDFTLKKLVTIIRAGGVPGAEPSSQAAGTTGSAAVAGSGAAPMAETMVRDSPGRCEEKITNSCPCCLCLLSCPGCS